MSLRSPLFGTNGSNINTGSTTYNYPFGGSVSSWSTNSGTVIRDCIASVGGTISNLYMGVTNAPGSGKSLTFTLQVNQVDSALTCAISDSATTASDVSHSVSVNAGDYVRVKCVPSGTPAGSGNNWWHMDFASASVDRQPIMAGSAVNLTSLAQIFPVIGHQSPVAIANVTWSSVVPVGGTVRDLYAGLNTAPGGSAAYTFTMYLNGSAQTLAATITGAATTANDTTHTVAVVAGDLIQIRSSVTNTPASSVAYATSFSFQPTTTGQAIIMNSTNSNIPPSNATNYEQLVGAASGWDTEGAFVLDRMPVVTFGNLVLSMVTPPGVGQTAQFTVRKNSASTALTATVSGTNTTASDTTHTFATLNNDTSDMQAILSAAAASSGNDRWGMTVSYPAPPSTAHNLGLLGVG